MLKMCNKVLSTKIKLLKKLQHMGEGKSPLRKILKIRLVTRFNLKLFSRRCSLTLIGIHGEAHVNTFAHNCHLDDCSRTITPKIIAPWQYPPRTCHRANLSFGWFAAYIIAPKNIVPRINYTIYFSQESEIAVL